MKWNILWCVLARNSAGIVSCISSPPHLVEEGAQVAVPPKSTSLLTATARSATVVVAASSRRQGRTEPPAETAVVRLQGSTHAHHGVYAPLGLHAAGYGDCTAARLREAVTERGRLLQL